MTSKLGQFHLASAPILSSTDTPRSTDNCLSFSACSSVRRTSARTTLLRESWLLLASEHGTKGSKNEFSPTLRRSDQLARALAAGGGSGDLLGIPFSKDAREQVGLDVTIDGLAGQVGEFAGVVFEIVKLDLRWLAVAVAELPAAGPEHGTAPVGAASCVLGEDLVFQCIRLAAQRGQ